MEKFLAWPQRPDRRFGRGEIMHWWGLRRLRYNGYLLIVGVLSLSITLLIDSPSDFNDWQDWLLTVLFLLIVVNICYTFGWIIDTAVLSRVEGYIKLESSFPLSCYRFPRRGQLARISAVAMRIASVEQ